MTTAASTQMTTGAGSTVQGFNDTLKQFLQQLSETFPEELRVRLFLAGFDAVVRASPRGPLDAFMDAVGPHSALVMARDPALFDRLAFPGGIDFARLWASPGVTDATREAIWQYVSLLMLMGTAVRAVPAELLGGLEALMQNCGDQVDFSALTALAGGLDGGALPAGLAAALGEPPKQPAAGQKRGRGPR
jgi:hypothetical protein